MRTMTPAEARDLWRALVDNASAMLVDSHTLLEAGSAGRARSLLILAQEELGKALWIYDAFASSWSNGAVDAQPVDRLAEHTRNHVAKYLEAAVFGDELEAFWGDYTAWATVGPEQMDVQAREASRQANIDKQRGFYVDHGTDGVVTTPLDVDPAAVIPELHRAAQVVEMLLIKDHSRMKLEASTDYDSTHAQQFRLLPISHPEELLTSCDVFRRTTGRPSRSCRGR